MYMRDKHVSFKTDALNRYLYDNYNEYSSRKRAGNEIVRFAIQSLGMREGQITFLKPIKPVGSDKKIVMSVEDNESLLVMLGKEKKFKLTEGSDDRYRAALLLMLCIGCRPIEARKTTEQHFSYCSTEKEFSLALPKEITKTSENYNWRLPKRFNYVWKAMKCMKAGKKWLDYDKLRSKFVAFEEGLGIGTEFTLKSIRKLVATKEYAESVRNSYLKEGGKALQHRGGGRTSKRYYVGTVHMDIPADLEPNSTQERKRSAKRIKKE